MGDNVRKGGLLPATCLISQHLPAADPSGRASPNSRRTWQSKLNSDCKLSWCGDSMHSSLVNLTKKTKQTKNNCLAKWVQESRLNSPTSWLIPLQELFLQQIVRPFILGHRLPIPWLLAGKIKWWGWEIVCRFLCSVHSDVLHWKRDQSWALSYIQSCQMSQTTNVELAYCFKPFDCWVHKYQ